jgi:nucleotide-binding universal stress UspA family protein
MSYKTILVHAHAGAAGEAPVRLAVRLALDVEAHLIGSAPSGISRFLPHEALASGGGALAERCAALRRDARAALASFERIAGEEALSSRETRFVDDETGAGLALQARYCDLIVVGKTDGGAADPLLPPDLPANLLLTGGRPVLVVPADAGPLAPHGEALLAWNGSVEAARAASAALPLLRGCRCTTVLVIEDGSAGTDMQAGRDLVAWLGRQGVAARIDRRDAADDAGATLLCAAAQYGAGLLVMGAYGHARLRELVLGGATATVLHAMTLPVLMAH